MPYVKSDVRTRLDAGGTINTAGELTYCLTKTCLRYLPPHPNFEELNAVVGALEMTKAEFLRRVVWVYENKKWNDNGDVYQEVLDHAADSE